jgi:hypothetical protein
MYIYINIKNALHVLTLKGSSSGAESNTLTTHIQRYIRTRNSEKMTLLKPRGVTLSRKYSLTVARHSTVLVAVPSTVRYPANYKIK